MVTIRVDRVLCDFFPAPSENSRQPSAGNGDYGLQASGRFSGLALGRFPIIPRARIWLVLGLAPPGIKASGGCLSRLPRSGHDASPNFSSLSKYSILRLERRQSPNGDLLDVGLALCD